MKEYKPKTVFEDTVLQDRLIKALSRDLKTLDSCAHLLKEEDFKPIHAMRWGAARWIIADRILEHYKKHQKPIGGLLRADVLAYARGLRLGERREAELEEYLQHLRKVPLDVPEAVVELVVTFKQERIRAALLQEMSELLASGKMTDDQWRALAERGAATARFASPQSISAAALYEAEYPTPRFVINPKLAVGVGMLVARPKIGKTWLALQLAIAVARGDKMFLGDRLKISGPVLYFALEDTDRRLRDRLRILIPKEDSPSLEGLSIRHNWTGPDALRVELKKARHCLVIIDPYLAIARSRKSTTDVVRDDYTELQPLRALSQEFETTILVVHHSRKADGDMRDVAIGTTGVTAAIDTLWALKQTSEGGMRRWEITGRDVEEQTVKLELTGQGWRKVAEGVDAKVDGPLQQRIVEFLHECAPMALKGIAEQMKENGGFEYFSVANALSKMVTAGLLVKRGHQYELGGPGLKRLKG